MNKIKFAIVGAGWRSEFFIRVAKALPDRFEITRTFLRDENKAKAYEEKYGIKTFTDIEKFGENIDFDFAVLSVSKPASPDFIIKLSQMNIPLLCETPTAQTLDEMLRLYENVDKNAKIQVAEQYHLQPIHSAMIEVLNQGVIGEVRHAQVSVAHAYHGVSLIRKYLGVQYENAKITATRIKNPIIKGASRAGLPQREEIVDEQQDLAFLDFGDKTAVFDFTREQYFSFIRNHRVLVRGMKGELTQNDATYLKEINTPINHSFKRVDTGLNGNLEGYYHKGIMFGEDWVYQNPFYGARLSDDEIAVGTCLLKMEEYVKTGKSFYSLEEALQDTYLGLMIEKSIEEQQTITTKTQPWNK